MATGTSTNARDLASARTTVGAASRPPCCCAPGARSRPGGRSYGVGRAGAAGFSLLELLVVVVIIGIFVGAAVLSVGVAGRDRESQREAARLRGLIDLVREEAIMQNRDFGILFNERAYRFYVYDYQQGAWLLPADDRLLAEHAITERLNLNLVVEDRELVLDSEFDEQALETPTPQVLVLSSGELTPFEVEVYRDFDGGRYVLAAEFDGDLEITERGFPIR